MGHGPGGRNASEMKEMPPPSGVSSLRGADSPRSLVCPESDGGTQAPPLWSSQAVRQAVGDLGWASGGVGWGESSG